MKLFDAALPSKQLELAKQKDQLMVKCLVRKKWIILTPEEWVRQHVIAFLSEDLGYNLAQIAVEVQVKSMGQNRRSDIVVFSETLQPEIIVECKAPAVKISSKTLIQLGNYVNKLQGNYAWMTNGQTHGLLKIENSEEIECIDLFILDKKIGDNKLKNTI